jgi:hypothetical protein
MDSAFGIGREPGVCPVEGSPLVALGNSSDGIIATAQVIRHRRIPVIQRLSVGHHEAPAVPEHA